VANDKRDRQVCGNGATNAKSVVGAVSPGRDKVATTATKPEVEQGDVAAAATGGEGPAPSGLKSKRPAPPKRGLARTSLRSRAGF